MRKHLDSHRRTVNVRTQADARHVGARAITKGCVMTHSTTRRRRAHVEQYRPVERRRAVEPRRRIEYVPAPTRRELMVPLMEAGLSSAQAYSVLRAWAIDAAEAGR